MTNTALAERPDNGVVEADALPTVVMPVAPVAQLVAAMKAYEETVRQILNDSDYQAVKGKRFKKRSGFSKLSIAYGVSSSVMSITKERNDDGMCIYAEAIVRAVAPNGRYEEGWGACSIREVRFKEPGARQKADHDIPATAETRARNRAYANLFGNGEVSYEEAAGGSDTEPEPSAAPIASANGEKGKDDRPELFRQIKKICDARGQSPPDFSKMSPAAARAYLHRLHGEANAPAPQSQPPQQPQAQEQTLSGESVPSRQQMLRRMGNPSPLEKQRMAEWLNDHPDGSGSVIQDLRDMSDDYLADCYRYTVAEETDGDVTEGEITQGEF